jgi:hypothetical protein
MDFKTFTLLIFHFRPLSLMSRKILNHVLFVRTPSFYNAKQVFKQQILVLVQFIVIDSMDILIAL